MSSRAADAPASRTNLADSVARDVGSAFAFPAGDQSSAAITADGQGRRRRSAVRASPLGAVRGLAISLRQVFSIAIAVEDVPRILRQLAAPHRVDRAVESREPRFDGKAVGLHLRLVVSRAEDP